MGFSQLIIVPETKDAAFLFICLTSISECEKSYFKTMKKVLRCPQ